MYNILLSRLATVLLSGQTPNQRLRLVIRYFGFVQAPHLPYFDEQHRAASTPSECLRPSAGLCWHSGRLKTLCAEFGGSFWTLGVREGRHSLAQ